MKLGFEVKIFPLEFIGKLGLFTDETGLEHFA